MAINNCKYCNSWKIMKLSDFFKLTFENNAFEFYVCGDCGKTTTERVR